MNEIQKRVNEHFEEACGYFADDRILGIFLQGSQNYGLDVPGSDVDTKLIVVPSLKEIAMNSKPVSTTHIRANEEHIDFKDVRLYIDTFRKQNLNFLEILFTNYFVVNPIYAKEWNRLLEHREEISHYNPFRAMKTMKGLAMEKYHAMEHLYPSKAEVLAKYSYDPKQLHHFQRIDLYMQMYEAGRSMADCIMMPMAERNYLRDIKLNPPSLEDARRRAEKTIQHCVEFADAYCEKVEDKCDPVVEELLDDVRYEIIKTAIKEELK